MPQLSNKTATLPRFNDEDDGLDWSRLLHRKYTPTDPAELAEPFRGKRILITGAGGSIGSAIARRVALFQPEHLVLLDSSEHGLYEIQNDLAGLASVTPYTAIPGDVCDAALLQEIFEIHRPQIVYHAAAYKHVPLMEHHPLAALRVNALGTYTLAQACIEFGVEQCILLSTDKAVEPSSIMGASKRVAELIFLALQGRVPQMKVLRLGNVLGSRGSVVPRFQQQIVQGKPITVTHPEIRRYFLTLGESVDMLLSLAQSHYAQGIFIPKMGEAIRILDLAHFLIEHAPSAAAARCSITFTGLRPGDKMQEVLLADNESIDESDTVAQRLCKLNGPQPSIADMTEALQQLQQAMDTRNADRALHILQHLVPEYQPSGTARHYLTHSATAL